MGLRVKPELLGVKPGKCPGQLWETALLGAPAQFKFSFSPTLKRAMSSTPKKVKATKPKGPSTPKKIVQIERALVKEVAKEKDEGIGDKWLRSLNLHGVNRYAKSFTEPGSKGRKVHNFLTGAAAVVAKLAPSISGGAKSLIPLFFLATHGPTQANAASFGAGDQVAMAKAAFPTPVASPSTPMTRAMASSRLPAGAALNNNPLSMNVGINKVQPLYTNGVVSGLRVTGMDKLADVPLTTFDLTTRTWREGELMLAIDLNPSGPAFSGTAAHQQALPYNRYKVVACAITFVSSLPATETGSFILSVTPDPDSPYTGSGPSGTQLASAVQDAQCDACWMSMVTQWCGDRNQNFYARSDGTDQRFVSPGTVNVVCNQPTRPDITGYAGSLFISYIYEFTERSLENSNTLEYFNGTVLGTLSWSLPFDTPTGIDGTAYFAPWYALSQSKYFTPPLGTLDLEYIVAPTLAGRGNSMFTNFPIGVYYISTYFLCSGASSGNNVLQAYNVGSPYYTIANLLTTQIATSGSWGYAANCVLTVTKQVHGESGLCVGLTSGTVTSANLTAVRVLEAEAYGSSDLMSQVDNLSKQLEDMRIAFASGQLPTKKRAHVPDSEPMIADSYMRAVARARSAQARIDKDKPKTTAPSPLLHEFEAQAASIKLRAPEICPITGNPMAPSAPGMVFIADSAEPAPTPVSAPIFGGATADCPGGLPQNLPLGLWVARDVIKSRSLRVINPVPGGVDAELQAAIVYSVPREVDPGLAATADTARTTTQWVVLVRFDSAFPGSHPTALAHNYALATKTLREIGE